MSLPFRIAPIRWEEVLRRSALSNPSEEEKALVRSCLREGGRVLDYKITERNRPVDLLKDDPLREAFSGCGSLIIFTARLGEPFREMVEGQEDPELAILYRGLAAERLDALIESYLDEKERDLRLAGAALTPHFPYHWEGAEETLSTTTRIVGISFHPEELKASRCRSCFAENCPARREKADADA